MSSLYLTRQAKDSLVKLEGDKREDVRKRLAEFMNECQASEEGNTPKNKGVIGHYFKNSPEWLKSFGFDENVFSVETDNGINLIFITKDERSILLDVIGKSDLSSFDFDLIENDDTQMIYTPNGNTAFVVLSKERYQEYLESHRSNFFISRFVEIFQREIDKFSLIPEKVIFRIANGESPIRVWRQFRGLKIAELAESTGINATTMSEIENAQKDASFREIIQISQALDVRIDDLVPSNIDTNWEEVALEKEISQLAKWVNDIRQSISEKEFFDSSTVRDLAVRIRDKSQELILKRKGNNEWLGHLQNGALNIIDEIDKTEGRIVSTVSATRSNLMHIFSNDLGLVTPKIEHDLFDIEKLA